MKGGERIIVYRSYMKKIIKKVYQLYELSIYLKREELMFIMLMFFETNVNKL